MVDEVYRLWREELLPKLASHGVAVLTRDKLTAEQKAAAKTYFTSSVFPALTPLAVDPGHPFPHLRNKSLNVAVLLRREGPKRKRNVRETSLAVVQVPSVLSRLVSLPAPQGTVLAVLPLEELIAAVRRGPVPRATRWSRRHPSASRATGTSTWTRRRARICSPPSRRSCAGETGAPRCGWSWTRRRAPSWRRR